MRLRSGIFKTEMVSIRSSWSNKWLTSEERFMLGMVRGGGLLPPPPTSPPRHFSNSRFSDRIFNDDKWMRDRGGGWGVGGGVNRCPVLVGSLRRVCTQWEREREEKSIEKLPGRNFFIFFIFNIFWGDFLVVLFCSYCIQHCFICRPSDSTVPTDAGIEPRTVATGALAVRRSNH